MAEFVSLHRCPGGAQSSASPPKLSPHTTDQPTNRTDRLSPSKKLPTNHNESVSHKSQVNQSEVSDVAVDVLADSWFVIGRGVWRPARRRPHRRASPPRPSAAAHARATSASAASARLQPLSNPQLGGESSASAISRASLVAEIALSISLPLVLVDGREERVDRALGCVERQNFHRLVELLARDLVVAIRVPLGEEVFEPLHVRVERHAQLGERIADFRLVRRRHCDHDSHKTRSERARCGQVQSKTEIFNKASVSGRGVGPRARPKYPKTYVLPGSTVL